MNVLIVSNMFPDKKNPSYGIFVSRFCKQLEQLDVSYDKAVMNKGINKIRKVLNYIKFYCETFIKCLLYKYDVVYIHYASHSSAPVLAANRFKKQNIVVNVHGSDVVPENKKQEKMQKYTCDILKCSNAVVVPSEYFCQYVSKKYDYKKDKIYVYPSAGIDNNIFYPFKDEKRVSCIREFNLSLNKLKIGYIGRISASKGWDTFVKAVSFINDYDNFEFILVGTGSEDAKLDELIQKCQLKNSIIRFPLLSQVELAKMYNCLDVLIFPTEREGESLGLVAVEAMACGTPVVSSDFAAPKYYIEDGVNGYKFEMGNEYALSQLILKFAQITSKEIDMLKQGALNTAQYYYVDNIINRLNKIFKVIENER